MRDLQQGGTGNLLQGGVDANIIFFEGTGCPDNSELPEDKIVEQTGSPEDQKVLVEFHQRNGPGNFPPKERPL